MINLSSQQKWILLVLCLFAVFGGLTMRSALAAWKEKSGLMMMNDERLEGLVHAPDFPKDMEWLNTEKPLALSELRGKLVLLDFWTFCCINCMHVIPDLKKLEAKYPKELVVIGVHSAKFSNEKGTDSIRQAILRYGIHHPVLNDRDLKVWNLYDVSSWPTLVLINPNGRIIGTHSGEGAFQVFDPVIQKAREYFSKKGGLDLKQVTRKMETAEASALSFPGKIIADAKTRRLFIADSNHARILITNLGGEVLEMIGSGKTGAQDGSFESASFHGPQGMFLQGDELFIVDTENHLIRKADLKTRTVTTILGTGVQSQDFSPRGSGQKVALNSPWDLLVHEGKLFIAMAGAHQIWTADLKTLEVKAFAGSGQEARIDGPAHSAAFAQPSGITTDGKNLYVADSEVSSIRAIDLKTGEVRTLAGEDLFVFGDQDGALAQARLQHPLGVAFGQGKVWVADTYNSKIKRIDLENQTITSFAGSGKHGRQDGVSSAAEFFEPAGLAILDSSLFVADTNNHLIREVDTQSGQVKTLGIDFQKEIPEKKEPENVKSQTQEKEFVTGTKILSGKAEILIQLSLPQTYHFTEGAPFEFAWASRSANLHFQGATSWNGEVMDKPIKIEFNAEPGTAEVEFNGQIYFCRNDSKLCKTQAISKNLVLEIVPEKAPSSVTLALPVEIETRTKKTDLSL